MRVLVTGAAGFVGSHFARAAHEAGLDVIALDNLSTKPCGWPCLPAAIERQESDIGAMSRIEAIVEDGHVDAIVHFAGRIRVDESLREPALYFEENLTKTVKLIEAATRRRSIPIVISSSAAVYGQPEHSPITESTAARPINPYGASKLAAEVVLEAYGRARHVPWAALRYFNAAGAHPDGTLCEEHEPESHLIPLAIAAARGMRPPLVIYGDDYPTHDGTCVRDYVHVLDLAEAHLRALEALDRGFEVEALNLGSARGYTVREVIAAVETAVGRPVPHTIGPRRAGDPAKLVASTRLAAEKLGWQPRRDLGVIVRDALHALRVRDAVDEKGLA
jgi:UDP-glucose-4-epimerase GalE